MNKDIVNCIKAEKDKETAAKKEKEEKIQKIKDFFKDLPEGTYTIKLTHVVTVKKLVKNPILSKNWWKDREFYEEEQKIELKEHWIAALGYELYSIDIQKIDDKVFIRKNEYYDYLLSTDDKEISNWHDYQIQLFYEHLDWFEKELGKEYCKHE